MNADLTIKIDHDIKEDVLKFLKAHQLHSVILVADQKTYQALGLMVEKELLNNQIGVKTILLQGDEIHPDEETITQVLLPVEPDDKIFLAVGSGTITDVVRFVSYRTKMNFISLPTAPSMDGYTANGSSLTISRLKQTVYSRPPAAIFAGLDTLSKAPDSMIASGFGDMLGKFTALPEWHIANLLVGEAYDPVVARRVKNAADNSAQAIKILHTDKTGSVRMLIETLIETGLCMLDFGNTRPASGAEHSVSHYWEYKALKHNLPGVFHGTKVGIATVLTARLYQHLRQLNRQQATALIRSAEPLSVDVEMDLIRKGYDEIGGQVIGVQANYLEMVRSGLPEMQEKIIAHWDDILENASEVPEPEELEKLLHLAGGPVSPAEINLTEEDVRQAMNYGFYIRSRFSLFSLLKIMGVNPMKWLKS